MYLVSKLLVHICTQRIEASKIQENMKEKEKLDFQDYQDSICVYDEIQKWVVDNLVEFDMATTRQRRLQLADDIPWIPWRFIIFISQRY